MAHRGVNLATCNDMLPLPNEFKHRPKTELVHGYLQKLFKDMEYVTISSELDALEINCPSLDLLVITAMKVRSLLKANGLNELVSFC